MKFRFKFMRNERLWVHPLNTPEFQELLKDMGIEVVKSGHDVELLEVALVRKGQPINGPTILFDRDDISFPTPNALMYHGNPNVIGFVVPALRMDLEAGKEFRLGAGYPKLPEKPVVHINVTLWHQWFTRSEYYSYLPRIEKRYRASFLGSTLYPKAVFPEVHRRKFMSQWHRISGETLAVFVGVKFRPMTVEESWRVVADTKVVVAPWGTTELGWRDYEACFGRCTIVKPRQEMELYCSPWKETNTVFCEPDFSDISEAVDKAESLWNFDALQEIRSEMIREATQPDRLARRVAKSLKTITDTMHA